MNIVIYHPDLHIMGGGERVMLTIASALKKDNEVTIFALKDKSIKELERFFDIPLEGVRIKTFGHLIQKLPRKLNQAKNSLLLKSVMGQLGKFDLVIDTCSNGLFYKKIPAKTLAYIHFPNYTKTKTGWKSLMNPLLIKEEKMFNYDGIIVNSNFTKDQVEQLIRPKRRDEHGSIVVINPPVDTDKIKQVSMAKKEKLIVTIGRYSPEKKLDVLIETFKEIEGKMKGYKLLIIGNYQEKDHDYFDKLLLMTKGHRIELLRNVPHAELMMLLSKARIYWHSRGYGETDPTEFENFGITTVEAMSAGCIPITINLGAQPEIIKNNFGFLWNDQTELMELTLKARNLKRYDHKLKIDYSTRNFNKKILKEIINICK